MSEYTTDQILALIEANGGPRGLDLSGKDLSGVDLGADIIQKKRQERGWPQAGNEPLWYTTLTADLRGVNLTGANLQGAVLANAQLQEAELVGANLQKAVLAWTNLQEAVLVRANLQEAVLVRANMRGADLSGASVQGVDLRPVASLEGAYFEGAVLDKTLIDRDKLGKAIGEEEAKNWEAARDVYQDLKMNWRNQGRYDYAGWARVKEARMWRKARQEELGQIGWRQTTREFWDWACWLWWWPSSGKPASRARWLCYKIAVDHLNEFVWEYGESPWRVALWLGITFLGIFPLFYWLTSSLPGARWYDYFLFSLRTSATLVFTEMGSTTGGWVAKLLASLEGVMGLGGYAAFVYTLGRRAAGY